MKATPSVLRPSSVRGLQKVEIVNMSKRHFNDRELEVLQKGPKIVWRELWYNNFMEAEYKIEKVDSVKIREETRNIIFTEVDKM